MEEAVADARQAVKTNDFDFEDLRPMLARLTRVAKDLFDVSAADVTLQLATGQWRANDPDRIIEASDPASEAARLMDQILWVEDLSLDPRFNAHPMVAGEPFLRFFAGASIILEDGSKIGTLGVFDQSPRARDSRLAGRLQDLAEIAAHELDRVNAVQERLATLASVAQSEQRLKIAIESAELYVYEIDYVNGSINKLGNESTFYERPQTFEDFKNGWGGIRYEDIPIAKAAWERHLKTGERFCCEYRTRRDDDREVWVLSTCELIADDQGRPLRMIGALQNITARREAEAAMADAVRRAESANAAKSVFLATMSHEIRTPLNGVLGMTQAMAADPLETVQRERLDVIRQSGEALLTILNDILDLSKIEAGKLDLEEIEFDLGVIASGAEAAFTTLANKKGIAFNLSFEGAAGIYRGDPTRFRQILYNLISNALKFTDAGEIRTTMTRTGSGLTLTVADTGIGMRQEVVANLFTKFGQADTSTGRKYGGTGLGLAICRELSEMMGGEIEATSAVGQGSTFTVRLPLVWVSAPLVAPAGEQTTLEESGRSAPLLRVLAAEDNPINQLVLTTLLNQAGIDPVVVDNGAKAVAAWATGAFDIILMDVQMPVMDGPAAARAIRDAEAKAGCAPIPIIALSANAMSHQITEYLAAGMDGHVAKPIEAEKLFAALEAAAERVFQAQAAAA